jgi:LmbE family N-acetylglucosaminyl deacetylase
VSGLMIIGAHPDDAEHMAGGVARTAVDRGENVVFLILTDGQRWFADPQMLVPDEIAAVRRDEARRGAAALGATAQFAGLPDGQLDSCGNLPFVLVSAIRQVKPQRVVTHSPNEGHTDHRAAAAAVVRVCNVLSEPAPIGNPRWFPDAGRPHSIQQLYLTARGSDLYQESALFVDTSAWIDDKVKALLCHASQFSDSSVFERSVRLTAAATGQIAGFDCAEGFLPAPGYPPRTRYTYLP